MDLLKVVTGQTEQLYVELDGEKFPLKKGGKTYLLMAQISKKISELVQIEITDSMTDEEKKEAEQNNLDYIANNYNYMIKLFEIAGGTKLMEKVESLDLEFEELSNLYLIINLIRSGKTPEEAVKESGLILAESKEPKKAKKK